MNLDAFVAEREASWAELDRLVKAAKRRPERLGGTGVRKLGELYRATAADLAVARTRWPQDPVRSRLESLVVTARSVVYGASERRSSIIAFVFKGYWDRLLDASLLLALAWILTLLGTGLGWLWAVYDPAAALSVLPAQFRGGPGSGAGVLALSPAVLATMIFTNNIRVAFLAFAGGITAGLITAALLAYNGLTLGVLAAVSQQMGLAERFWSLIVPHGLLELSCIAAAAAAGFRLAGGIVDPGPLPRSASIGRAARPAVEMAGGTAILLVIAGLIEGFITPQDLPLPEALAVGICAAALFWVPLLLRATIQKRARALAKR